MRLVTDWRQLSPKKRFRHAYTLGYAFFLGYWMLLEIDAGKIVFDGKRWITMYPDGKGPKADGSGNKKGRRVQIESTTGEILKGPFKGQKINELSKNNKVARNEVSPTQAQHHKQAQTSAKTAQAAQTQQQERDATLADMKARMQELSQGPQTQRSQYAHAVLHKLIYEPLDKAGPSPAAQIAWLKSLAPKVHTEGLYYLKTEELHDVLSGVERTLQAFPSVANNIHGFTNIGLKEAQYQKEYAQYSPCLERAKAAISANKSIMQQLDATIKVEVWPNLYSILNGNSNAALDALKYKNTALFSGDTKERVSKIIANRSLQQLSKAERSDIAKLILSAAKTVAIEKLAVQKLEHQGISTPKAPDDLTLIKRNNKIGHAGAAFNPDNGEIWLSQYYLGPSAKRDLNKNYRAAIKANGYHPEVKNWISCTTAVLIHEMVHCLDNLLRQESRYFRSEGDSVIITAYNRYLTDKGITNPNEGPYAARNQQEFFAEMLTEALTAPKPTQLALDMLTHANELYVKYLRG